MILDVIHIQNIMHHNIISTSVFSTGPFSLARCMRLLLCASLFARIDRMDFEKVLVYAEKDVSRPCRLMFSLLNNISSLTWKNISRNASSAPR